MIEKLKPCPNPLCRSTDVRQGKDCLDAEYGDDSIYVTCEDCGTIAYLSAWHAMQARQIPADVRDALAESLERFTDIEQYGEYAGNPLPKKLAALLAKYPKGK